MGPSMDLIPENYFIGPVVGTLALDKIILFSQEPAAGYAMPFVIRVGAQGDIVARAPFPKGTNFHTIERAFFRRSSPADGSSATRRSTSNSSHPTPMCPARGASFRWRSSAGISRRATATCRGRIRREPASGAPPAGPLAVDAR